MMRLTILALFFTLLACAESDPVDGPATDDPSESALEDPQDPIDSTDVAEESDVDEPGLIPNVTKMETCLPLRRVVEMIAMITMPVSGQTSLSHAILKTTTVTGTSTKD